MGVVVVKTMPAVPPLLVVVAIVASIFASPCTAGGGPLTTAVVRPKPPLVENLPTTVAAQDFIHTRCAQSVANADDQRMCYELLLPYATSINGSYNRATIAGVTGMVSRLTSFLVAGTKKLEPLPGECIQVVKETIAGANKEALAKLGRIDDNVAATNPDLTDVATWILAVAHNFDKCPDDSGDIAVIKTYVSINDGLVTSSLPFRANSLPSPDGTGP